MFVAATPPITTVASAPNPMPMIVTLLPPVVLPLAGAMPDTWSPEGVGPEGEHESHAAAIRQNTAHADARIMRMKLVCMVRARTGSW